MFSSSLTVKLILERDHKQVDDIRRVSLPEPSKPYTVGDLQQIALNAFGVHQVKLRYLDDENDRIVITSQDDVDDAIEYHRMKCKTLRILVEDLSAIDAGFHNSKPNAPCESSSRVIQVKKCCDVNKQQILNDLDSLIRMIHDISETNENIRDLKSILDEAYRRISQQSVPEEMHRVSLIRFRQFVDEIVNGNRMECEYFPIKSDESYLVPVDLITFLNRAISKKRRDESDRKNEEIETMKREQAALKTEFEKYKAEFEKYREHAEKRSAAQSAMKMVPLVPNMSKAELETEHGKFIASANTEYRDSQVYYAFRAFDESDGFWHAASGKDSWIQIQLPSASISNVVIMSARKDGGYSYSPSFFLIQASNDGNAFDTLLEVKTSWYQGEDKVIPFENDKPYKFYRIFVKNTQTNTSCAIRRLNFGRY